MGIAVTQNVSVEERNVTLMPLPQRYIFQQPVIVVTAKLTVDGSSSPPPPKGSEQWNVGFIQNVVFDMIAVEYEGGKKFSGRWDAPILDASSDQAAPFYAEAWKQPIVCRPLIYDGSKITEVSVAANGQSLTYAGVSDAGFAMSDGPQVQLRAKLDSGASLISFQRAISLQTWLVARKPNNETIFLLGVGPETLYLEASLKPLPQMSLMRQEEYSGNYAWTGGIETNLARLSSISSGRVKGPQIQAKPHPANVKAVMDGDLANARGMNWIRANALIPKI